VADVSFQVRPGEILGVAGVEGNGQTELCAAIFGLLPIAAGVLRLDGCDMTAASVAARRQAGVGLVPEDRHRHGLVLDFSLAENLMLGHDASYAAGPLGGLVDRERLAATARALLAEYDVHPPDPSAPARSLSGGNQQKVVIARELHGGPRLLLAAQPSRGVDIGAIESIHRRLLAARDRGCAILLFSAELDELRALCDRICVMYRGLIVAELANPVAAPLSREVLGELMTGAGVPDGQKAATPGGDPAPAMSGTPEAQP
jgi:simple sugar transport system ATP-binding protein